MGTGIRPRNIAYPICYATWKAYLRYITDFKCHHPSASVSAFCSPTNEAQTLTTSTNPGIYSTPIQSTNKSNACARLFPIKICNSNTCPAAKGGTRSLMS